MVPTNYPTMTQLNLCWGLCLSNHSNSGPHHPGCKSTWWERNSISAESPRAMRSIESECSSKCEVFKITLSKSLVKCGLADAVLMEESGALGLKSQRRTLSPLRNLKWF